MIISKAAGVWGEGADEATFNLEVLGNTPQEVAHLATLVDEPVDLTATFENGALKVAFSFKRKVSLEEQAAKQAADEANAAAKAKAEAERRDEAAQEAAEEEQKELHASITERAAQILADRLAPKG